MRLNELRRKQKEVSRLLLWRALVAPGVVKIKDGLLMSTLALKGKSLDAALDAELVAHKAQLNNALKRLGAGWGLLSELRRRHVTTYPKPRCPDALSARLDGERQMQFIKPGAYFVNDLYLTLTYEAKRQQQSKKWSRFLYKNLPPATDQSAETLQWFQDEVQTSVGLLRTCYDKVVVMEEESFLTYLHSTISTKLHRVRMPDAGTDLAHHLPDQDVRGGLYPKLGEHYIRCVSPRASLQTPAYPAEVYPGILDTLAHLPIEFRATLRYIPLSRQAAVNTMSLRARRWGTQKTLAAQDYAQGCAEAQRLVQQGKVSQGHLTTTVVVWDEDLPALDREVTLVEQALNDVGFLAKAETLGTMAAWMGSIPGNLWANPRKDLVNSADLAQLLPSTSISTGQSWNEHLNGPPALQVRGKGRTVVGLSLHQGQVGHTAVIGSTGDGKSTMLNALCLGHRQYPGQEIAIFDKQYAARHLTAAVNGAWYDLGVMPLQPLANLDQPYEIPWALDWLDDIYEQERLPLTPTLKEELANGLAKLAEYDAVKRTLSCLGDILETPELRYVLKRFPQLDGTSDPLADNPWMCFEMATLLDTPRVLNVVLPPLFHRLEQRLTGAPTMYMLHEGWIAFDTPYWQKRLRAYLKGLRARNGWVVVATQSQADAATSAIMPALLDNVKTWIFTPNVLAQTDKIGGYYADVGLNERQREILALGKKQQDYYLKQDTGSGMVQLDLGAVGLALCATPMQEELAHIEELIAQHGPGQDFAAAYLAEKGITL